MKLRLAKPASRTLAGAWLSLAIKTFLVATNGVACATETLEHILVSCPYYADTRQRLVNLWISIPDPTVKMLALSVLAGPSQQLVRFILDASSNPLVIKAGKHFLSAVFYLTRTWCYSIHRKRAKLLSMYSFD